MKWYENLLQTNKETSLSVLAAEADQRDSEQIFDFGEHGGTTYRLLKGKNNLWVVASIGGVDVFRLRQGFGGVVTSQPHVSTTSEGYVCEWITSIGAMRLKVSFPKKSDTGIHTRLFLLPATDVRLSSVTRDFFPVHESEGIVHTKQRGLRTGIWLASIVGPEPMTILYVQDFSNLNEFFECTGTSPAGTVGGDIFEAGYLPPITEDSILPKGREIIVSDVHIAFTAALLKDEADLGGRYLDLLAQVYLRIERPDSSYHSWPDKAARTMRDLLISPACSYERGDRRYLMPYVADDTKPPESMVQLTVLVNAIEYDTWAGRKSKFVQRQLEGIAQFYDPDIGTVVRWLPGENFGEQSEENMNHECMDSWYLYHSLFNVSRLATLGHESAKTIFRDSLPFAMRVARRFDYKWPIFFDLKTLDIVRAESAPGAGGENDVAGLYALVMLHAYELFSNEEYLQEAERAAQALQHLGFDIGYQMNSTGFAAEALLRLWKIKGNATYLKLSEMCMANIFDNMWLWRCTYGYASHYRNFFGLFPLHEAPYLAAYEELECQAKFHEYLALGGEIIRPSLRLLMAEYQKYSLDRGWYYYPEALPSDVLAENVRNGRLEPALSIPLEDMQDGRTPSGEVGQEIYGAGLAMVYTARHYTIIPNADLLIFCEYPVGNVSLDLKPDSAILTFTTGGTELGECRLRVIRRNPENDAYSVSLSTAKGAKNSSMMSSLTVEGDDEFLLKGGTRYEMHSFTADKKLKGKSKTSQ
jgi:hypothetical protein